MSGTSSSEWDERPAQNEDGTWDALEIIVRAAPIVRRFVGQPSRSLGAWMRKQEGFQARRFGGREQP